MAIYECGFQTAAATTGAPIFDLRTASSDPAEILEIGLFCNAATASSISLFRPATVGTSSTTVIGVPLTASTDPAPTSLVGTAWSAAPTVSSNVPTRRVLLPANIGAGVIWTWAPGTFRIPVSSSLLCWNQSGATNSVLNGYIKWVE